MNKQEVLSHCKQYLEKKRQTLQKQMKQLQDSLNTETKSSAGDKHETGRAMVQLEQEKLSQQLLELQRANEILKRIEPYSKHTAVHLGSLVKTNVANYFVAISCEMFQVEGVKVFCISKGAPIARAMTGKHLGDTFLFNGVHQTILELD